MSLVLDPTTTSPELRRAFALDNFVQDLARLNDVELHGFAWRMAAPNDDITLSLMCHREPPIFGGYPLWHAGAAISSRPLNQRLSVTRWSKVNRNRVLHALLELLDGCGTTTHEDMQMGETTLNIRRRMRLDEAEHVPAPLTVASASYWRH